MELQTFNFENQQVRTIEIENRPYFVGKDVAEILGRTPKTYKRIEDGITLIAGYNFLERIKKKLS